MKFTDLDPRWTSEGPDRHGQGFTFLCPHCVPGRGRIRLAVDFANPVDGGPPVARRAFRKRDGSPGLTMLWHREGDTFATMTITPSIDASEAGHWHGFILDGQIR